MAKEPKADCLFPSTSKVEKPKQPLVTVTRDTIPTDDDEEFIEYHRTLFP